MATGPMLNGPAEIVQDKYARSVLLAKAAALEAKAIQDALNALHAPPSGQAFTLERIEVLNAKSKNRRV